MGVKEYHAKCCPSCGDDSRLVVDATTRVKLLRDGAEDLGDHDWNGDSYMSCRSCGHDADASEFEWDSDHPHWPTDDDEDDDELHDDDCECSDCEEARADSERIAQMLKDEAAKQQGRIGLVHEHTLDDMRRAIEKSGVLKSIDTTEGENS